MYVRFPLEFAQTDQRERKRGIYVNDCWHVLPKRIRTKDVKAADHLCVYVLTKDEINLFLYQLVNNIHRKNSARHHFQDDEPNNIAFL